ncbi:MAG: DUF6268 family outer membrane beta-barrel protein [Planctomycetota bacterium]
MQQRFDRIPQLALLWSIAILVGLGSGRCLSNDQSAVSVPRAVPPEVALAEVLPAEVLAASTAEAELRRFKPQALQSLWATTGGLITGRDDLSLSFMEVGLGTGIPLGSFDNVVAIRPRFRVDWLDAPESFDLPSQLYDFELQFAYRRVLNERLSLLGVFSPSARSDLTTSEDAFRMFGLGLINWQWIPDRLTISFGAVALGRADLPVLPAMGVQWTPTRRTRLELRFPESRFAYRMAKDGRRSEVWLYSSVGLGGNTWAVTRSSGLADELSLRDYRLHLGIERLVDGGGRCFAELGAALGRRLEYERNPLELQLGDAFSLRAGWRY